MIVGSQTVHLYVYKHKTSDTCMKQFEESFLMKKRKEAPTKSEIRAKKARLKYGRNMKIIGMFKGGATVKTVMEETGLKRRQVFQLKAELKKDEAFAERKPGSGRKRKTTSRVDRAIVKSARSPDSPSADQIRVELLSKDITVCERTVRRRLHESGNRRCVCTLKPWVCERNRMKRLKFAKKNVNLSIDDWKKVIWSDESKFVFKYAGRKFVWRRVDERHSPRCMQATVKGAQKSVMVWGCFSWNGVGSLHRVVGNLNAVGYRNILSRKMVPGAKDIAPSDYIFQQDNAPIHTAKVMKNYFKNKGISVMEWPPQSPDLNPIENLWYILDHMLKERDVSSEQELFECLQEGWKNFPNEELQKLIESMPKRCALVIKNKGFPIKY